MMQHDQHQDVRTTLALEKDVAAGLKAESWRTGRAFKDVVYECLRAGLLQRETLRAAPRFSVKPRDFGPLQPGVSLDDVAEPLERIERPDRA